MPWRHTRVLWFTTAACRKHSRSSGISSKVGPEMREVDLSDTHLVVTGLWGAWWSSTLLTDGDSGCISGLGTGAPCSCRCSSHPSEECRKGLRRTRVFSTWLWSDRRRCSWAKARAMRGLPRGHRVPSSPRSGPGPPRGVGAARGRRRAEPSRSREEPRAEEATYVVAQTHSLRPTLSRLSHTCRDCAASHSGLCGLRAHLQRTLPARHVLGPREKARYADFPRELFSPLA